MRLDKPIGILLLAWPTLWGLWLSSLGKPDFIVLWIFVVGIVLMRSAGCVVNDYADRHFDPHVERTRNRPLAAGRIRISEKEALILAGVLALLAFLLILPLKNWLLIQLSVVAAFLAASYPYTKRFLAIPQAYLGIAFGFGIPMAYAAQLDAVPPIAWLLMSANVFWAIAYDTEYAMVDRADDLKIGIKTSALTFGRHDVMAVMICYGITLTLLGFVGWQLHLYWPYYLGLAAAAGVAVYHYTLIKDRQPAHCFKAFLHNNWFGAAVFAGLVAGLMPRFQ
ncbi:MAG: 4-hydroxybenzoate octaprenyltransferase [Hydrogenophilales bacterium CG03_land_8_20_14_0_80_62_28]|nr:4-hydroxybenzoate octaprenyltransferase [Betaproteobacteria bacterium]OIO80012.1 MAG: 4-hydroxybenzoate polyprenyltransferase [Hydrogenophilaceae bacterium CG1_02_62_390]PIV22805.1 MAG: 4-hydroxybenzoate octaprenyltransferase [Hydrogenophilales bacterium CG03_land_8_20_14_0_80_62_28]PIW39484.1 MAG: 4-hydroxybenzoate octaprenyltransferase [Hydrogenophilales bacterium CG15_BIG_FIL_POST_REV_8_21_14_020_62_31]PIW72698.1 MAG: 4-hydroxybenzoate octaprenyltransferase [Hydrogenophilales bacterium CG